MKKNLILCPVDYSESTEPAVAIAADLAQANQSKVVLLHVADPKGDPISIDDSHNQKFQDRLRDQYLSMKNVQFEHVSRRGDPAEVTVEYAKKAEADLIVMGTHGRSGLASVMVGSVARRVMARAPCPVVTVKLPSVSTVKS